MISAVIAARNEAARIGEIVERTAKYVDEVIVVDDASSDDTASIAKAHGAQIVINKKNEGQYRSQIKGILMASGEIVVNLDADGEYNPEDIPKVVAPIQQGKADMVFGKRPSIPRISEALINQLARLRLDVTDTGTGLRAFRKSVAQKMKFSGRCVCGTFALEAQRLGARICEVPVSLNKLEKNRKIAWWHWLQCFYVSKELLRSFSKEKRTLS